MNEEHHLLFVREIGVALRRHTDLTLRVFPRCHKSETTSSRIEMHVSDINHHKTVDANAAASWTIWACMHSKDIAATDGAAAATTLSSLLCSSQSTRENWSQTHIHSSNRLRFPLHQNKRPKKTSIIYILYDHNNWFGQCLYKNTVNLVLASRWNGWRCCLPYNSSSSTECACAPYCTRLASKPPTA